MTTCPWGSSVMTNAPSGGGAAGGGGCAYGGTGCTWEFSAPSQNCCELKTSLKKSKI